MTRRLHDQDVGYVTGTFRLVYRMAPLASVEEQRAFASTRGLLDAWPLWRPWLNGMLAAMGLGPPPLPARVPKHLGSAARDAFDATLQVKASIERVPAPP